MVNFFFNIIVILGVTEQKKREGHPFPHLQMKTG